jgi:hypothetical protein
LLALPRAASDTRRSATALVSKAKFTLVRDHAANDDAAIADSEPTGCGRIKDVVGRGIISLSTKNLEL